VRSVVALSLGLFVATAASSARADVSSWLAVGGGFGLQQASSSGNVDPAGMFTASVGVGSAPDHALVAGGLFRSTTYVNLGTDIGIAARLATNGFVRGGLGVAVDLGVAYRYWRGGDYGTFPLQAVATLGLPAGMQLGVGGTFWSVDGQQPALGGFVVLEMDFLRLTLMRKGNLEDYWPNPSAAGDIGRGK